MLGTSHPVPWTMIPAAAGLAVVSCADSPLAPTAARKLDSVAAVEPPYAACVAQYQAATAAGQVSRRRPDAGAALLGFLESGSWPGDRRGDVEAGVAMGRAISDTRTDDQAANAVFG